MAQALNDKPVFEGLNWYRDEKYSLFVPPSWHRYDWPDGRPGVLFMPSPEDPQSLFGIVLEHLDVEIRAEDRDDLKAGFLEGIQALEQSVLEEEGEWTVGDTICLEAKYTFFEENLHRKRWVKVFYTKDRQISLIAQGSSPEAFQYWLPMYYEAMMTARLHEKKPSLTVEKV